MSDFAYGLSGFMDAYQRARGGGRGQGRQTDPYVEQERYNKLKKENDDKAADQAYQAVKSLASGGKDPTAIQPPPQMPVREPGNSGYGMQRPGSLGGPSAGGGYGGGPLFGGGMGGGGMPLDMNMGPIGIPLGILSGLGQALGGGGGKQGAPSGQQGLAAAAPRSAPAAPPPAAPSPPGAAGGPSPLSPTYTGEHPAETFQPSGNNAGGDNSAPAGMAAAGNGPPMLPAYTPPDLSGMKQYREKLQAAGYDQHAIDAAMLQFGEDQQKASHQQRTAQIEEWKVGVQQWKLQHDLTAEQDAKVKEMQEAGEKAAKAKIELEEAGLRMVRTKQEIAKAERESADAEAPGVKALRKQLETIQKQMADRRAEFNAADTAYREAVKIRGNVMEKQAFPAAEEEMALQKSRREAAQKSMERLAPRRRELNKALGQEDEDPTPEDAPRDQGMAAAPAPAQPGLLERGAAAIGSMFGGGGPTEVKTPQDAAKLPKGTHYRTPDGQEFVR